MGHLLIFLALLLIPVFAAAEPEEKGAPLRPDDFWEIRALIAERDQYKAEFQLEQAKRQQEAEVVFQKKRQAVIEAIEKAAKNSGVKLSDGWLPDADQPVWVKPKKGKP